MKRSLLILMLVAALCLLAAPGVATAAEEPETFLLAPYYNNPDRAAPIDLDYVWANEDRWTIPTATGWAGCRRRPGAT